MEADCIFGCRIERVRGVSVWRCVGKGFAWEIYTGILSSEGFGEVPDQVGRAKYVLGDSED